MTKYRAVSLRIKLIALSFIVSCVPLVASEHSSNGHLSFTQTGEWQAYMSYYKPQQIFKGGNRLYVRASNSLYSYHLTDHSIVTYDKMRQLSDVFITHIAWSQEAKKLIIVYDNQNIDLLSTDDTTENISALFNNLNIQDRTINAVTISGSYAYLSTNFGIVKVNMKRAEIAESYVLNRVITATAVNNTHIYAKQADGTVLSALLTDNLLNASHWQKDTSVPTGIFNIDTSDWDQYISTVQSLQPGGPKYNNFSFMKFKNNKLYTCGGGYNALMEKNYSGLLQILDNNEWVLYQENLSDIINWNYKDIVSLDIDPKDPNHVMAAGKTGLYEFKDGIIVKAYNINNSPLESSVWVPNNPNYTLVEGICYDQNGNLWCLNSQSASNSLLEYTEDGEWKSHNQTMFTNSSSSLSALSAPFIDSRNLLWFINQHWNNPAIFCYDMNSNKVVNYFINELSNQDGTVYSNFYPHFVTEDVNGNIWICSKIGTFMIENSYVTTIDYPVTQIKVPRNDGTDYADYLLNNININCMIIDGGNRKWFGTEDNGLYLISADNMKEIKHFTSENSPLLSNEILSLSSNPETGEIFIGTGKGLCSYMSDATEPVSEMDNNQFLVYPNPVPPDYQGIITIRGFSFDADVKILTSNGKLIKQGRSNGGTFTWDGCDENGSKVATGVYMVVSATDDGNKGSVCKIGIIR